MKKIIYSPGEPSGIGPDLIIKLCRSTFWTDIKIPVVCLCDPKLLNNRAADLEKNITLRQISDIDEIKVNQKNVIQIMHISECRNTKYGKLYKSNAQYVLDNLEFGINEAFQDKNIALVTGPISKENIISINKKFSGHTEFIQQKTNSNEVLMLLASDQLKVALITTHIPLKNVSKKITKELIISKAITLNKGLKEKFKIKNPIIKMLGLNPHSGEGGKIGKEEVDIIIPAVKELRKKKINISYPISADTAFTKKNLKETDAFLGMYHDQVLPVIKALSFGNAINVTLGVPITRTSVDHGVALDIAGSGKADPSSLKEAIKTAKKII